MAARDGSTACEKAMMTLSRETIEGLRLTGMHGVLLQYSTINVCSCNGTM